MRVLINRFSTQIARGAYVKWAWAVKNVSIANFDFQEGVENGNVVYYLFLKADDGVVLKELKHKLHIPESRS